MNLGCLGASEGGALMDEAGELSRVLNGLLASIKAVP
jgi:hypothetical protein